MYSNPFYSLATAELANKMKDVANTKVEVSHKKASLEKANQEQAIRHKRLERVNDATVLTF